MRVTTEHFRVTLDRLRVDFGPFWVMPDPFRVGNDLLVLAIDRSRVGHALPWVALALSRVDSDLFVGAGDRLRVGYELLGVAFDRLRVDLVHDRIPVDAFRVDPMDDWLLAARCRVGYGLSRPRSPARPSRTPAPCSKRPENAGCFLAREARSGGLVARLTAAYVPRRPTETALYALVRDHLETFLTFAREQYERGLPRYVEDELRGYLKCGVFAEGFLRARCDACGHDLLVAFTCKSRTLCPSCAGRRMASTAAAAVDRVLPDVPVRQYVLSLPWELRMLAAVKAPVLTALGRLLVDAIFAGYRARAKRRGLEGAQCGAINFVQRFGSSLNLNVHFHAVVVDGVWTRSAGGGVQFHAAGAPTTDDLAAIVEQVNDRALAWLRRNGHIDGRAEEEGSQEPAEQTALGACAAIAMARGRTRVLGTDREELDDDGSGRPGADGAVDRHGFNLHAGVTIPAGDDEGREKLCRYAARPALSLQRLRRLRGGLIAYHLKYVRGPRGKHRIMDPMECLARLTALVPPPRYPLVRYAGVLGPRSAWRKEIVPRPREFRLPCATASSPGEGSRKTGEGELRGTRRPDRGDEKRAPSDAKRTPSHGSRASPVAIASRAGPGDVERVGANMLSVRHWDRLLGGVLYAATPRMDWARLLQRSLDVDVLKCPKCDGRLRIVAAVTERASVTRILAHLGVPSEAPAVARARDPTDDTLGAAQLELRLE